MPILWGLDALMTKREVSGYRLAIQTGLTASAIYKLRHNRVVARVEGDTLARLCAALKCQPGDLLEYVPGEMPPPKKKAKPKPAASRKARKRAA